MFDIGKFIEESTLIIGLGLISYTRLLNSSSDTINDIPPTIEDIKEAYQNIPRFNMIVNTIVAQLLQTAIESGGLDAASES